MRISVLLLLSLWAGSPSPVHGQGVEFGVGGAAIVSSSQGVGAECYSRNHRFGLAATISTSLPVTGLRLAATGRYFGISPSPSCEVDPFVPRDGVYTFDDHVALQAVPFGTTDLRLQVEPLPGLVISGGGGMAWRGKQVDRNAPSLVAGLGTTIPGPGRIRFHLGVEVTWFRFVHNTTQITFEDYKRIAFAELGESHSWDRAVLLTASAQFSLP